MINKKIDGVTVKMDTLDRQGLNFIEDQTPILPIGACACPTRSTAKKGVEKLHHGGENDWRIPVFGNEFVAPSLTFRFEIGMVFKHPRKLISLNFQ